MNTAIIIPARYASTRLPGKPLLRRTGKYLVQHVYERASQARRVSQVIVATDDPRIVSAVKSFGGRVALTHRQHRNGTERVAEVAACLDTDLVLNLQGDEPLIDPAALDALCQALEMDPESEMATLAVPILSGEEWRNPNCVKVVRGTNGKALYFSRSPIPFVRDDEPRFDNEQTAFLRHVGIYAYRRSFLLKLASMPVQRIEQLEQLEQLRVLALGHRIRVQIIRDAAIGVDTLHDYERFVAQYRQQQRREAA